MNETTTEAPGFSAEERRAIAEDLRILAMLHDSEPTRALIERLRGERMEDLFALPLDDERGAAALDFFRSALAPGVTRTDRAGLDELAADHAAIYLTHAHRVSPSESPWIDPEGLTSQQPMFEVRDWYRHHGLEVPDWRKRSDDHLVVQLEFVAHLLAATQSPIALIDAAGFLDRHLLRWYEAFAAGVVARCWTPYWAAVAEVTGAHLAVLRARLAGVPGVERIEMEPIEQEKERLRRVAAEETCASPTEPPGLRPSW